MQPLEPVGLDDIRAAATRLSDVALLTPLLRLEGEAPAEVHLKLENLQPTGSFKVRGAGNAIAQADPDLLARGLATASAGNMGRAVAWLAKRHGIPATVVVPDDAPAAKLEPIAGLGARIVRVSWHEWWQALVDRGHPALAGAFVHPFADPVVMAGNGTISLEIVEQLPNVDAVVVPFGGGGLSCGIAAALKALRPDVRVFAAEVATAAPLAASLEAGHPVTVDRRPSFVDGIGGRGMLPEMWPLVSSILDGSIVVSVKEVRRRAAPAGDPQPGHRRRSGRGRAGCRAHRPSRERSRGGRHLRRQRRRQGRIDHPRGPPAMRVHRAVTRRALP